jgi:hypothetical protein
MPDTETLEERKTESLEICYFCGSPAVGSRLILEPSTTPQDPLN